MPRPGTDEGYFARAADQSEYLDAAALQAELNRKESAAYRSPAPSAGTGSAEYMRLADVLERDGKYGEAVRLLRRAARGGGSEAARRLGDYFDKGRPGVPRDYSEALQWNDLAKQLDVAAGGAGKK